ncbi:hypothetical protein R3P38DRAFT_2775556 [Favolaschia claudopus]|uniref:Uncharacterized protein n=1 Tax=Favolaschia claudopus TaxID=2862362 RepID=A0AAW0BTV1_9AGAR
MKSPPGGFPPASTYVGVASSDRSDRKYKDRSYSYLKCPRARLCSLILDQDRGVASPDDVNDAGFFISEQNHTQHPYEFNVRVDDLSHNHQFEANYTLNSESSSVNTALAPQDPWSFLDNVCDTESLQHIPIANQHPGDHDTDSEKVNPDYPYATPTMLAGMVPAPEPTQSQYNDPYVPVAATIPGLEPTNAPHHQFCALLIERNINPYDFISFMLAHRHLDADRLRAILSGLAGRRVPSRRRRAIPREARICSNTLKLDRKMQIVGPNFMFGFRAERLGRSRSIAK